MNITTTNWLLHPEQGETLTGLNLSVIYHMMRTMSPEIPLPTDARSTIVGLDSTDTTVESPDGAVRSDELRRTKEQAK